MSDGHHDGHKDLKRKTSQQDDKSSHSEKKRRKKESKTPGGFKSRPKHCPLSERQQLALLMQMTAEENTDQSSTPPPTARKPPGSSGRKDKVNKRNERGETPLHIATIRGELPLIIDLIKQGADINVQDYAGWTPLHEACNHGYQDIAKFLLEAGATVNSKGLDNDYPLHDAVINEHVDLVKLLLKHGANPLLPNKHGERPLDLTENEEIKQMMQNEILSSDESERTISPNLEEQTKVEHPKHKTSRMEFSTAQSESSTSRQPSGSSASRELFKSSSSSSDSDDSDDVPLSRKRSLSTQSKYSSSSSNYDSMSISSSKRGKGSTGILENKWKSTVNQRRLFSTESSDSADSEVKSQLRLQPKLSSHTFRKHSSSSDEEIPLRHTLKEEKAENKHSTDCSLKPEKRDSLPIKLPTTALITKTTEPDVYDFSPTADDFSSENDAISLKPDNRTFSKRENSAVSKAVSKSSSLFSRKPQSIFTSAKGFDFNDKKARKLSWDSLKSPESGNDSGDKTVHIKPVVHETSEMMFDRLFKSPKKEKETPIASIFNDKPKHSVFSPKEVVTAITCSSVSVFTTVTSSTLSTSPKSGRTKTFAPSMLFSGSSPASSSELSPSKSNSVNCDEFRKLSSSIKITTTTPTVTSCSLKTSVCEVAKLSNKTTSRQAATPGNMPDMSKPCQSRSLSLDSKVEMKKSEAKKIENENTQNLDEKMSFESKPVKKIKTEIKEKVSKTVSDPSKKISSKSHIKEKTPSTDAKKTLLSSKSLQSSFPKKESKNDQKKVSLLPKSKSNFMNDIESISRQRHLDKMKRKKLMQKKTKTSSNIKTEEKKPLKKPEVKLLDTDSWLGSPVEKQKKLQQRPVVKKVSDSTLDNSLTFQQDDNSSNTTLKLVSKADNLSAFPTVTRSPTISLDNHKSENNKTPQPYFSTDPAKITVRLQSPQPYPSNLPTADAAVTQTTPDSYSSKRIFSPKPESLSLSSSPLHASKHGEDCNAAETSQIITSSTLTKPIAPDQAHVKGVLTTVAPQTPSTPPSDIHPSTLLQVSECPDNNNTQEHAKAVASSTSALETFDASAVTVTSDATSHLSSNVPDKVDKRLASGEEQPPPADSETANNDTLNDESNYDGAVDSQQTTSTKEHKLSKEDQMLQEYIQQRLSLTKILIETNRRKRLPVYIPLHELMGRKKDPAVDKLNVYEERVAIQKKMFEKRKKIISVIPQAPQYYWEYMTFTGGYLLNGSRESHLSVPVLAPPPFLCEPMVNLFNAHEERRVRLRVQHAIQREKLIISCEQEIMRVHSRAARTIQNQQVPFSACAMLLDNEVYNMPRNNNENETGKTSIRDRFNARMFISWLQDVDDKYDKMKSALLARQKHEAAAMFAVQKTEWILKRQELDHSQRALKADEINEVYVPIVNIADDFDLLPA